MDEDGYVQIVGRNKDMIIRGGENIYPLEVEQYLFTHPKIIDVQVISKLTSFVFRLLKFQKTMTIGGEGLCYFKSRVV